MHPVLFQVGPFSVGSHAFFVALALLVGALVFAWETRRRRAWDDRLLVVIAGLLVGGAVGGRLAGVLDAATRDGVGAAALAWQYGGRSILGGLSGAYVGALIGKRCSGYPYRTGDLFAPAVALALAVGRIGCFLTEAPGRPTGLPLGIAVDPTVAARIPRCPGCVAGLPMHPSFLYESAFCVVAFGVLLWLRPRISAPGELLVVFLASYAVFRFLVEFTRANEVLYLGLTRSQLFLLVTAPLLGWRLVSGWRRGAYHGVRPGRTRPSPDLAEVAG
jgi:prolipoprotein diacylglyceryl transferase